MEDMDWRLRGACRDEDPERFFPVSYKGERALEQVAEAKAVCHRCPVSSECLNLAISEGLPEGIFGGCTPEERPKPKRRKGKPKPAVVDEVAVARAIAGKPVGRKLRKEERVVLAERMLAAGRCVSGAAEAAGCSWSTLRGLVAS